MPRIPLAQRPACDRAPDATYTISGHLGAYLEAVTEQWLKPAPHANPAILDMLRDRDRRPRRNLLPWSGEFAGKHLTAAVQVLRLTGDDSLRVEIAAFVEQLVQLQDVDGYLGPFPQGSRLTGTAPNVGEKGGNTWDAWGHYHATLGLLLWHDDTGDRKALACARRIGDLICRKFLRSRAGRRLVDTGSTEMNLAVIHSQCLLYRKTGTRSHLDMAVRIAGEFGARERGMPLAGDYVDAAQTGMEFWECPKPRWESLHPIMGMLELYWLTGEERYRAAFEHWWWSIVKLDRHNNGGFTSGERAQGNPYHRGAIETCCTIAWIAMSVEMLRLTGDSRVADEIELSTLNSVVGLHSSSGRWVTYNTPMDGVRKASAHDIVFQAREGSPELNCCSVNGPRGLGMISDWALMRDDDGLLLNYYGPSSVQVSVKGTPVTLTQTTEYPRRGRVVIAVTPARRVRFALKLRLPYWSERTRVQVNGRPLAGEGRPLAGEGRPLAGEGRPPDGEDRPEDGEAIQAGTYLSVDREWRRGDVVVVDLDFRLHVWVGEKECRGRSSLYRGPALLTYDRRFNARDPDDVPELDAATLRGQLVSSGPTMVLIDCSDASGGKLRLCDFGSAGEGGSPYLSWLPMRNTHKTRFSRANPRRSGPLR